MNENDKDVPKCYNRMLTRTEIRENLLKLREKM